MVDIIDNEDEERRKLQAQLAGQESRRSAAVALKKFGVDESALPKVVAAGYGKWAEQIVEMAFKNGIKVREDKELAQMLAAIELDSDIPTEALVAIAEILAYVYKANGTYHAISEGEGLHAIPEGESLPEKDTDQ